MLSIYVYIYISLQTFRPAVPREEEAKVSSRLTSLQSSTRIDGTQNPECLRACSPFLEAVSFREVKLLFWLKAFDMFRQDEETRRCENFFIGLNVGGV
jgi:hypothetical protein